MLAWLNRVYDRWTHFHFEQVCRGLAQGSLAEPEELFRCVIPSDKRRAGANALAWVSAVLAPTMRQLAEEPLPSPALREAIVEAHRRLPTRQRRLLLLYLARGHPFDAFAARLRMPQAQALRVLSSAITAFQSELAAVELTWPGRSPLYPDRR